MRITSIFKILILIVTFQEHVFAQNAQRLQASCLNNINLTYEKAQAVLRGNQCQMSANIKDCTDSLGLSPEALTLLAGGGSLAGGAAMMKAFELKGRAIRPKNLPSFCGLPGGPEARYTPIENGFDERWTFFSVLYLLLPEALASRGCVQRNTLAAHKAHILVSKMNEHFRVQIEQQQAEIQRLESQRPPGDIHERRVRAAWAERARVEKPYIEPLDRASNEFEALRSRLMIEVKTLPDMEFVSWDQAIDEYDKVTAQKVKDKADGWTNDRRNKFLKDLRSFEPKGQELDKARENYGKVRSLPEYKAAIAEIVDAETDQRDYKRKAQSKGQEVNVAKDTETGEKIDRGRAAMESRLEQLQSDYDKTKALKQKIFFDTTDAGIRKNVEEAMKFGSTPDTIYHLQSLEASMRSAGGRPDMQGAFKAVYTPQFTKPGEIKVASAGSIKGFLAKTALGVLTTAGVMSAASAADLEKPVGDALDVSDGFSMIVHSGELGSKCSDHTEIMGNKLGIRRDKETCDIEMNSELVKLLGKDKDEFAKALRENNPDLCTFINEKYNRLYPEAKTNCGPPTVVEFPYQAKITMPEKKSSGNLVIETLPPPNAKQGRTSNPYEFPKYDVKYDRESGQETGVLTQVFGGRGAAGKPVTVDLPWQGSTGYSSTRDRAKEYYTRFMPAMVEAAACCSKRGVTPSDEDCKKYGVSPSGFSSPGSAQGHK